MKLECKHKPHFSGRELGFVFRCTLTMALLFALISCVVSTTSVIKLPSRLGAKGSLSYELLERGATRRYNRPELIEVEENGSIYLGYDERLFYRAPDRHMGFFSVDIIVWNTRDPNLIAKFL